ncbi:LysE family translocator [Amorphus orientalis]|uniref:Threonine/homoserine/homoserine lactone efflux protein n=1 Tax=Amorphus orientalis TaxID=649198 RepID=A0AAE3VMM2_9HYPH|nr:LysE family translocator [Amorphus orientalis]MDQ0315294.1 threonine/homoserine/homoserine lactone efflux protein [Amorphus orientalis]
MTIDVFAAYVVATLVVLAIPGPTVLLVVSYAVSRGRRATLPSVVGVALGDATAATVSLLGLGALLAASASLFVLLKWIGAAYLVYLGVKMWRQGATPLDLAAPPEKDGRRILLHAWLVTALNPKGIVFFIAFLPQFVSPASAVAPQLLLLGATFVLLAIVNAALYAVLASAVRDRVRRPATLAAAQRIGGSVLIAAGVATATVNRTA